MTSDKITGALDCRTIIALLTRHGEEIRQRFAVEKIRELESEEGEEVPGEC
jgi:hypothetical protein